MNESDAERSSPYWDLSFHYDQDGPGDPSRVRTDWEGLASHEEVYAKVIECFTEQAWDAMSTIEQDLLLHQAYETADQAGFEFVTNDYVLTAYGIINSLLSCRYWAKWNAVDVQEV